MILADVIEVVGHRAAHVQLGVVLQQLEQLEHRPRIFLERAQARRPGQARPRPFGNQAAHVWARVAGPLAQSSQRGVGMFFEKRADAVFGGEALRQRVLRAHRIFKMIESVLRHEEQVRHVQKRRHAARGAMLVRL